MNTPARYTYHDDSSSSDYEPSSPTHGSLPQPRARPVPPPRARAVPPPRPRPRPSSGALPLPPNLKHRMSEDEEEEADTLEEGPIECKFLEHRYFGDETDEDGLHDGSWKIIPAGSAPPPEPPRRATTNKYDDCPLVLISDYDRFGKAITDKRLQVHSPALKAVIRRCIGYRNTQWKVSRRGPVEISWPWQDWFRGLAYFKKERNRLSEQIVEKTNQGTPIEQVMTREHDTCELLIEIIEKYHKSTIKEMNECIQQGSVTYDLLWTLFDTFQELYTEAPDNTSRAYEYLSGKYVSEQGPRCQQLECYLIQCRYIDYDGEQFQWIGKRFLIPKFKGVLKITSLPIYPLIYHPEKEGIREELITRGRKFESLRGIHYMRYGSKKAGEVESVAQRLMIDAYESPFRPHMPEHDFRDEDSSQVMRDYPTPALDGDSLKIMRMLKEVGYCLVPSESSDEKNTHEYTQVKKRKTLDENDTYESEKPYTPLPDFYCVFTTNTVGAFDLIGKHWTEVDVMDLTQPTWSTDAFDSLVLGEKKKELIKALVEQHKEDSSRENTFDDFIPGKGKGLIYVLHGPPGVGKTLTAEAVSEYTKSPLYVISAGELGTSASRIENRLNAAFRLCARWNALMLLDEADIFMEARSLHEIDRNACVSVFLKVLEYYKGILFLTTNRAVSFDEAFRSRVHLTLKFDELDHSSRLKIWEAFVNKMRISGVKVDISEEELAELAMKSLNGREIKNAIKLAQSLARKRDGPLNAQALLQIIEIQEGSETYSSH